MVAGISLFSMPSFLTQKSGFGDSDVGDGDHMIYFLTVASVE